MGLTIIGAVALVATGVLTGVAYTTHAVPTGLQPAVDASVFPVSATAFDDARPVKLSVTRGPKIALTAPVDGRVTRFACSPGASITSGTSPLALDGAPVIALATSTPLWRDLAIGDKGDDVTALQQELARLGYTAAVTGKVDRATLRAFTRLRESVGEKVEPSAQGSIGGVLWLPAVTTGIESCPVAAGSTVTAGDDVATVPGALLNVSIIDLPLDLVDGARVLTVDGTSVPFVPSTATADPATLSALDGLPSLGVQEEGDEPVNAKLVLSSPIQVSVVPPSAVFGSAEQSCVMSAGRPTKVQVVGSELGQSFVLVDGPAPQDVDVTPPEDAACG
ncbi:hypothetical protein Cch01nite_15510 [Cellulomonas chitinilytica]|uniref:Peptidoglycan binding-like domain-containing protein n=1 Tax=Cellulomonas chitinilytica TaxID=398759 RepID=A0A919U1U1_9CELL|nr:hypothetical protein Cch01nite_15510 [Cellulomonas chitinilytica]